MLSEVLRPRSATKKWIFDHSGSLCKRDMSVSYFDCTNYYLLVFGDNIEGIIDIIEAETVEALKKELPVVKGLFLGAGIEDPGKNQESEDPVNTVGDGKIYISFCAILSFRRLLPCMLK